MSDQPEGYARLLELADRLIADGDKASHVSASECHEISEGVGDLCREVGSRRAEIARLLAIINIPRVDEFFASVRIEAAHQIQRWGVEHDAGKRPEDWVTLVVYLLGKASKAHFDGDEHKLLHHVVTLAAVALNWHRNITGDNADMRPGIGPDDVVRRSIVTPPPELETTYAQLLDRLIFDRLSDLSREDLGLSPRSVL